MDREWLKGQLDQPGKSQRGLAKHLGIDPTAVNRLVHGGRKLQEGEEAKVREYLNAAPEPDPAPPEPEAAVRPRPQATAIDVPSFGELPIDVPVMGVGACGEIDDIDDGDTFELNGIVDDYVRRPPGIRYARQAFCIRAIGQSMEPRHREGDLIYLDPARPPTVGDDVVIELHNSRGEAARPCVLKVYTGKGHGVWLLAQFNPPKKLRVKADRVARIYKVLSLQELLGT